MMAPAFLPYLHPVTSIDTVDNTKDDVFQSTPRTPGTYLLFRASKLIDKSRYASFKPLSGPIPPDTFTCSSTHERLHTNVITKPNKKNFFIMPYLINLSFDGSKCRTRKSILQMPRYIKEATTICTQAVYVH